MQAKRAKDPERTQFEEAGGLCNLVFRQYWRGRTGGTPPLNSSLIHQLLFGTTQKTCLFSFCFLIESHLHLETGGRRKLGLSDENMPVIG